MLAVPTAYIALPPVVALTAVQLVERANKWAAELDVSQQVHYLFTNVSVSLSGELGQHCRLLSRLLL
jgi:hypothetical protein